MSTDKEFKSPTLAELLRCAASGRNASILDLGGAHAQSKREWQKHFKEVCTLDFRQVLRRLRDYEKAERLTYLEEGHFCNFKPEQTFDAIVAWDFLNYLDDQTMTALFRTISRFVKDSTLLTALSYSGSSIPAVPRQYSPTALGFGVAEQAENLVPRTTPPINSLKIQKCLPNFFIKSTFTAQPGMQRGAIEYLLVFKDSQTQMNEKAALYEQVMQKRKEREAAATPNEQRTERELETLD